MTQYHRDTGFVYVLASTLFDEGVTIASIAHTEEARGFYVRKRSKGTVHATPSVVAANKSVSVTVEGASNVLTTRRSPQKYVATTSTVSEPAKKVVVQSSVLPP